MIDHFAIRYTGHYCSTLEKPQRLSWHSHKCPEIVFVIKGKNRTLFPQGISFQCTPGCMLITPAAIEHKQIDEPCCELYYAGFESDKPEIDLSLRILDLKQQPFFGIWMKQIHLLMIHEKDPESAAKLLQVLLMRLRKFDNNRNFTEQTHPALCKAIAFLKDHFTDPVSIDMIAGISGISPSRLNALFQRDFKCSIMQFLIRKRMEHARILLMDPMKTITEVADLTGYSNMNYFVRAFKKEHGITPLKYRKSMKIF